MTPEIYLTKAIKRTLSERSLTMIWLSEQTAIPYSRLQRVLDLNSSQQLTISDADNMLRALGSSLENEMAAKIVARLRQDILDRVQAEVIHTLAFYGEGERNFM